jgi:hypothetical protein
MDGPGEFKRIKVSFSFMVKVFVFFNLSSPVLCEQFRKVVNWFLGNFGLFNLLRLFYRRLYLFYFRLGVTYLSLFASCFAIDLEVREIAR